MQECLETVSNNFPCHTISLPSPFHQISPRIPHFITCTSLQRDFPQTRACLSHSASCHHGGDRCTSEYTPPAGQRLGSALKYQRKMNASGNGPAWSIVAVKTVKKESWRKQSLSALIQRQRKLIAAAKRSRNQVDLSLLNQAMQHPETESAAVASSSAAEFGQTTVRTLFGIGSQLPLRRRRQPKRQLRKHCSSGEELIECIHWNFINYDMIFSNPGPSSVADGRHTNIRPRAATKTDSPLPRKTSGRASPAGSRALLPGRAIKGMVGTQEFALVRR